MIYEVQRVDGEVVRGGGGGGGTTIVFVDSAAAAAAGAGGMKAIGTADHGDPSQSLPRNGAEVRSPLLPPQHLVLSIRKKKNLPSKSFVTK